MEDIIVLQHIDCETLGTLKYAIEAEKLSFRYVKGYAGEAIPENADGLRGLAVMGGPMSAYEEDLFPFLTGELKLIDDALGKGVPIFAVCLGSQLLAKVLGAPVYPGKSKEIGWHEVRLSPDASDDPLWLDAPREFQGFHWHGDVFDLPDGAKLLASSSLTACQAYRLGENVYATLFHMEVERAMIARWSARFAAELVQTGQNGAQLIEHAGEHLEKLQSIGKSVYSKWARLAAERKP